MILDVFYSLAKRLEYVERSHKITRWEESSSTLNNFWLAAKKSRFEELKVKLLREATERQHLIAVKKSASKFFFMIHMMISSVMITHS